MAAAAARSDPATTDASTPSNASPTVMVGPAPNARSVPRSRLLTRNWRPITWPAISRAAKAAIPPKTPSAIDSGLMARSALAAVREVT